MTAATTDTRGTAAPTPADTGDASFFARREHFGTTTSTNDVVARWLAEGWPEVALATADEQTQGRGRDGRTWQAPAGSSLLLSLGFRPTWLAPDRTWQLAAVTALAMAHAAEDVTGLAGGAVRLKWPNDLVVDLPREWPAGEEENVDARAAEVRGSGSAARSGERCLRKLAGVLGETTGLGTDDPRAIVGIGINVDWRRADFPPDIADTMTSLRDASGDAVDRVHLLDAFLGRIETGVNDLRARRFALADWQRRQVTTGRSVDVVGHDGTRRTVKAVAVDGHTGGLIVQDEGVIRTVHSGEILHVRLVEV